MFWERLTQLCAQQGTTPTAVINSLKLSRSSVTYWKHGSVPKGDTLQKIADYFNVSVDYLLGCQSPTVSTRIPVYGKVAAGIPIEAITDIEDYEEITPELASKGNYIALKIKGDSMSPYILNGDTVIVRLQNDCEDGDIAIVLVEQNDATCKKIKKTPQGLYLMPLNTAYEPIFYDATECQKLPVSIIGVVAELRRSF